MGKKILFIEPPKADWFVMGEYLPPPYGIIQLAAYLEKEASDIEIKILDCNALHIDWEGLETDIESFQPDITACSSLATCNTYVVARTLQTAKKVKPDTLTITGGQHFTATAQESMGKYPEIDVVVRGEGEQTLAELVKNSEKRSAFSKTTGISYREKQQIIHNSPRQLIENLDDLPFPAYHLVKDTMYKYHFASMAGRNRPYALIEGGRGCPHECTFCTQWRYWQGRWRVKSPKRIAEEMEFCYRNYGSRFIWLTDDNFGAGNRPSDIADEVIRRDLGDMTWFVQSRCDDIVRNGDTISKLAKSGLNWVLLGVENSEPCTLESFKKNITADDARKAVKLLKDNGIFAQAMFIIGERKDTRKSIALQREFANSLDPDLAIFAILTPFPGNDIYEEAKENGWIEDFNWAHYDMVHAVMPTQTLSTKEVQEELYECYRSFYGSWKRRLQGIFTKNAMKRRIFLHMATRGIIGQLKALI
jgi:anaerobic magnesium-protoporphyrin IX monomethyl ester cyclase